MTIKIEHLNDLSDEEFVTILKDIFEHSPWVAQRVADQRPFKSVRRLHAAMCNAVAQASEREQLDLICAHPDLAGKAALAGELTDASTNEQAGAGLDTLNENEYARFNTLNESYRKEFQFPFILAVKGHDKHSIMASFEQRLQNDQASEMREALKQIGEIARFRLEALLEHSRQG